MKFRDKIEMRKIVTILGVLAMVISGCGLPTRKEITTENAAEPKAISSVEKVSGNLEREDSFITENSNLVSVELFVKYLTNEEKLQLLFNDNWTFVYHADDRCDGSTDGQISNLEPFEVDEIIRMKVVNDGEGWLCDKKEPKEFYLDFNLKEHVKDWDRIEIANYEIQEKNIVHVEGWGSSDYIKLYYDDNNLIVKMEYRREDPG